MPILITSIDFKFANGFMDPGTFRITSIVDWQNAVVVLLSLVAEHTKKKKGSSTLP